MPILHTIIMMTHRIKCFMQELHLRSSYWQGDSSQTSPHLELLAALPALTHLTYAWYPEPTYIHRPDHQHPRPECKLKHLQVTVMSARLCLAGLRFRTGSSAPYLLVCPLIVLLNPA